VPAAPARARWTGCSHVVPWQVRAPAPHRVRGSGVPGGEGRRVLACLAATRPRRGRREDGREASAGASPLARPSPARRRSAAMVRRPWRRPRDVRMALCRTGWCARLALTPRAQASPSGRWASRSSRACRTAAGAPPPAPRPAMGSSRVTLARPLRPRGVRAASLRPSACATRRRTRAAFLTARAARPSAAWTTACPRLPTWRRPVFELTILVPCRKSASAKGHEGARGCRVAELASAPLQEAFQMGCCVAGGEVRLRILHAWCAMAPRTRVACHNRARARISHATYILTTLRPLLALGSVGNTRFPHAEKQARPQQVTLLQSVVICCQICADCCPPLAYRLSSASQSGGAHIGRTGDAATQCCHTWWPENTTKECTSFVLVFSYAHARAIDRSCDRGCHKAP